MISETQQTGVFQQPAEKTIAEDSLFSNIFLDGSRHDWSNRFESDIMHSEMIHNFYGLFKNAQMQGVRSREE